MAVLDNCREFHRGRRCQIAKRKASPLPSIVDHYLRINAYAAITTKRIAIIEAYWQANTTRIQAELKAPPAPTPPMVVLDGMLETQGTLSNATKRDG